MLKKNENNYRRNNYGGNFAQAQKGQHEHRAPQEHKNVQELKPGEHKASQEQGQHRENVQYKNQGYYNKETRENRDNRDNTPRQSYQNQNSSGYSSLPKINSRVKTEETIDDIAADIVRIEKEIQLEIKEIKSMRLGL